MFTDDNMEELVKLVNEELDIACHNLRERLINIDYKLKDVRNKLAHLYDALETGKFDYDDLAPRIVVTNAVASKNFVTFHISA